MVNLTSFWRSVLSVCASIYRRNLNIFICLLLVCEQMKNFCWQCGPEHGGLLSAHVKNDYMTTPRLVSATRQSQVFTRIYPYCTYTVKKVSDFPYPAGNNLIFPARESLVSNLTKSLTFFYSVLHYCIRKQPRTHLKQKAGIKGWPVSWPETSDGELWNLSSLLRWQKSGGAICATDMMRRIRRSRSDLGQEGGGGAK